MAKAKAAEKVVEDMKDREYWLAYRDKMVGNDDEVAYANAHLVILNIDAKRAETGDVLG